MRLRIWGARGSLPSPGSETTRYGGNTSTVQLDLDDGSLLILDAGSGLRALGQELEPGPEPIHILLSHLHLDHIQGLMFFAPCFDPDATIVVWGPPALEPLERRLARYISAPLAAVDLKELPCDLSFRDCPSSWQIGSASIRTEPVTHRGPTLGFRVSEGTRSLTYLPDHEPGLSPALDARQPSWVSGIGLARDTDLLIHDAQYTDAEYELHRGWGHSCLSDAIAFADLAGVGELCLFHHDPLHSDADLDDLAAQAFSLWSAVGRGPGSLSIAREGEPPRAV